MDRYECWLRQYVPHVASLFFSTDNLERRSEIWKRLAQVMHVRAVVHAETHKELMVSMCNVIRERFSRYFLPLSMRQMLYVHGYVGLKRRQNTGACSTICDIRQYEGQPVKLIGKIIDTCESRRTPDSSPLCYAEACIARQIQHPNVMAARDIVICGGKNPDLFMRQMCMIQDCAKADLYTHLKSTTMSQAEVLDVALQITEGLHNIHEHQFVHMDVKPQNMFVFEDGRVAIGDFGLSFRMTTQGIYDGHLVTLWYRPPELILAGILSEYTYTSRYGPSADMWSLGMCLWDLMCESSILQKFSDETPKCRRNILKTLVQILGTPDEEAIQSWNVGEDLQAQFHATCPRCPPMPLFGVSRSQWRKSTKSFPEWFTRAIFELIEDLLSWNVHKRPSAEETWNRLNGLLSRVTGTSRTLMVSPASMLDERSLQWRRENIKSDDMRTWWSRSENLLNRISNQVKRVFRDVPAYKDNPNSYLDVLVLSSEILLRTLEKSPCQKRPTFTQLHNASFSLALQMTRPWWGTHSIYNMFNAKVSELQQVEVFIASLLDYRLYLDNYLTQQFKEFPHRVYENREFMVLYVDHVLG